MWLARAERIEAYVGQTIFGWKEGATPERWLASAGVEDALAACVRELETLRAQRRRAEVTVWMSGSLARPFMLPADCGAQSHEEALALARGRCLEFSGLEREARVWLGLWRDGRDTVSVAMATAWLQSLESAATGGVRLLGVRPWWNAVLDTVEAEARASGTVGGWSLAEPDGLVSGTFDGSELAELHFEQRATLDLGWVGWLKRQAVIASPQCRHLHCVARLGDRADGPVNSAPIGAWAESTLGVG